MSDDGRFDIVVGLPSYNEADSIARVTATVDRGLRLAFPTRRAVIVNVDSDSEDHTQEVFSAVATTTPKICRSGGVNPRGKGVNVLSILRYAYDHGAECVALFDADVVSLEPEWVSWLLEPVIRNGVDLVTPIYTRNRYEGNTTNHLMYPYVFAVLGQPIRQPIAGDFALSGKLCEFLVSKQPWESTLGYGIDIFITAHALATGFIVQQRKLTKKIHKPSFGKMMTISSQELDTLFHIFLEEGKVLRPVAELSPSDSVAIDHAEVLPDEDSITRRRSGVLTWIRQNLEVIDSLFPMLFDKIESPEDLLKEIDLELWVSILTQAFITLNHGSLPILRDSLIYLYMCRVFSTWPIIQGVPPTDVEHMLDRQAQELRDSLETYFSTNN